MLDIVIESPRVLTPRIFAKEPTTLMLLGGEPLGERFIWWNFVSKTPSLLSRCRYYGMVGFILSSRY